MSLSLWISSAELSVTLRERYPFLLVLPKRVTFLTSNGQLIGFDIISPVAALSSYSRFLGKLKIIILYALL